MKFIKEQKLVRDCGMIQSMSIEGNCLDNSPTVNFFEIFKSRNLLPK